MINTRRRRISNPPANVTPSWPKMEKNFCDADECDKFSNKYQKNLKNKKPNKKLKFK